MNRVGIAPLIGAFARPVSDWPRCRAPNFITAEPCGECDWCIDERIRELDALNGHGWKTRAIGFSTRLASEDVRRRGMQLRGGR